MKSVKWLVSIVFASVLLGSLSNVEAHVTLTPNASEPGSYDEYSVRVPVERAVPTTKLELEVPDGVSLSTVEPVPGFKHTFETDKQGNIKKITWEATGKGIGEHEHVDFPIVVANPEKEGKFMWKAVQTYKDGKKVSWTDEKADSEHPAPVTEVKKGSGTTGGHGHHHGDDHASSETGSSDTALWIVSILALVVSLIALFKRNLPRNKDK